MKLLCTYAILSLVFLFCLPAISQTTNTTIKGVVKDSANNALSRASITIKGSGQGTTADENGNFSITTKLALPLTLVISNTGYADQEIGVSNAGETVSVVLKSGSELEGIVVTGGSRKPESYLGSPVSVEIMNNATIRNAPSLNYYSGIANLKGVDLSTSSLTFQTVSTRGFNGSGNLRFNQLIDGMDNQAPGLNFSVGNIIGLTELDVDNVELLPGASSALYGSGGMNGTMLMTSKSPFKYQGLSLQYKQGINHVNDYRRSSAPVFDGEIRFAKAFKNKFAFKVAAKYFKADDWQADDSSNLLRNNIFSGIKGGNRASDPNYDGVNIFGDEASASMQAFAQAVRAGVASNVTTQFGAPTYTGLNNYLNSLIGNPAMYPNAQAVAGAFATGPFAAFYPTLAPALPFLLPTASVGNNPYAGIYGSQLVSRMGYKEKDLVDYNTYNFKITGGLFYKINNNVEASVQAYFGRGTTVYTGSDRYSLKNLQVGQYKFELKSANWFFRAYTTQENSGDSYTATTAAVAVNASWKPNLNWFQQYTGTYGAARLGLGIGLPASGLPDGIAHNAARTAAETGRFLPGTQQYNDAFNKAISTPISKGGAKFADKTNLYHAEGQYNFTSLIKVVDVLAGASYRVYHLNSGGTIFADTAGPININEYGAYLQLQKKLFKDVLKLTASGRYDKNENFKGRFTPRFSALVQVAKDNNIRLSYQIAYRFPSAQDQYINLQTPSAKLIGGLPVFNDYYKFGTNPAYTAESIGAYRASFAGTPNPSLLQVAPFVVIKPETVNSYEIGYRGLVTKRLLIDAYAYTTQYKNFIGRVAVGRGQSGLDANKNTELASPFTTTNYSFAVNSSQTIKANGWGLGVEYRMQKGYTATANVSGDQLRDAPAGFVTFFNTPKVRYNLGLGNLNAYKHFGFNVIYRWQDKVNWEGTFGSAQIPSFGSLDAHISYTVPKYKSLIKLGATNLLNKYYRSAFGNPYVGGLYYISIGYNVF